jgi:hypothetical protein
MTTTATETPTETTQRCDFSKVKVGDVFTRHSFGTVIAIDGTRLMLKNSDDYKWSIDANILEQEFCFAEQFDSEQKVSRTAIIDVIDDNPGTAMTVQFYKKAKHLDVAKDLKSGKPDDMTDRAWSNKVKKLMDGEERIMVGKHHGSYDEHRRLHFTESGKGARLVDPRTVQSLIVRRIRYVVK